MGLRDDRFWALTPRLFRLLQDRWYEHERRQDRRAGEMVAAIYNVNRDPKKSDIFKWDEFFPGRSVARRQQTDEEMLMAMQMWVAKTGETKAC
jgi:hypothetical protein